MLHSNLLRLFSIALLCSLYLQLWTVIFFSSRRQEEEERSLLHLVWSPGSVPVDRPSENCTTSKKTTGRKHFYIPVKKDYDQAAPNAVNDSGRCHFFPSISHRQTLRHLVTDQTAFLSSRTTIYEEGLVAGANDIRPLYMYNPSLIPLTHMDPILRDEITGRNFDWKQSRIQPHYLSLYRVSTFANCFGPLGIGLPVHTRNYQGLALLDEHLEIVPGTDVVVDVNYWIRLLSKKENATWEMNSSHLNSSEYSLPRQRFTDCGLAVMPAFTYTNRGIEMRGKSDPSDELYMICGSRMLPIAVHRFVNSSTNLPTRTELNRRGTNVQIFPNEYGGGLRFSLLNSPTPLPPGKNFNVFRINTTHHYMEYHPSNPHEAFVFQFRDSGKFLQVPLGSSPIKSTRNEPSANWLDPETFREFPFQDRDRGGGCCVEIVHRNKSLLVGISHRKTRSGRESTLPLRYLSRLYAMEMSEPFNVVSKTGLFCLGFGTLHENRDNIQVGYNEELLRIEKTGKSYQCPTISFVSSLSEHATNSSLAIISFGINDCYPRMIVVEKAELTRMLFPDDHT